MRKTWKRLLAVSTVATMLFAMAACNKQGDAEPTAAPDATEAPADPTAEPTAEPAVEPTAEPTAEPTEAPSSEPIVIHNITGGAKRDTLYFGSRGSGVAFWADTFGKDGEGSIQVSSRSDTWHGVSLSFTDATYTSHDVVGKEVFVSFDVYQETGAPIGISCTLQVNKPDGSQDWPERVSNDEVPSGEWTHMEGTIPVYANALAPSLNFESSTSANAEFFLDNVYVSYDPSSSVDPNPDFEPVAKVPFENVSLDFEDGNAYFAARGDSVPAVVDGALSVTGRTANWNGAQADYSAYDLAGKTIVVSFLAKHDEAAPIVIKASVQESDGTNTTYATVAGSDEEPIAAGEWVRITGSYTVLDTTVAPVIYFEATDTASFFIDDVVIGLEGTVTIPTDDATEEPAEPTEAPVEPTEAPAVEPTEAPAEPTEAPAEPTEAPAEPTKAPAEPTEAPAEPTEAPAPTATPVPTATPAPTATPVPTEAPKQEEGVINFAGLEPGGYGYEATVDGDSVKVVISGQYQEIQYVLPETIDLAKYSTMIVDVVSDAQLGIKLVNPEAVANEWGNLTEFYCSYTAPDSPIAEPVYIDLTAWNDYDLSQINFMGCTDSTNCTVKSVTFVE